MRWQEVEPDLYAESKWTAGKSTTIKYTAELDVSGRFTVTAQRWIRASGQPTYSGYSQTVVVAGCHNRTQGVKAARAALKVLP